MNSPSSLTLQPPSTAQTPPPITNETNNTSAVSIRSGPSTASTLQSPAPQGGWGRNIGHRMVDASRERPTEGARKAFAAVAGVAGVSNLAGSFAISSNTASSLFGAAGAILLAVSLGTWITGRRSGPENRRTDAPPSPDVEMNSLPGTPPRAPRTPPPALLPPR
jgi:hypothetical protein